MSLWAWRLGLGLLLSSLLPLPPLATGDSTYATVCGKTGKYKINSTYQDNVQYVTNYLVNYPTFTAGTGFASTSYGAAPDVVYGLGLCRGDTPDNVTCYECLSTASEMAPLLCPHDKDATLFYDGCIMRISNQDFLGTMDNEPVVVLNETMTKPAALVSSFDALVGRLMNKTAEHAAASSIPTKKMATGEAVFDTDAGDDQPTKVYSLVQCTPDLTPAGCSRCLEHVLGILALRTPGSLGERVAGVRCNLRFQVYPFYVGEAMVVLEGSGSAAPSPAPMSSRPLPPPSPRAVTPPASPPNNNKKGTKTKIWIIAVSVPLLLLLFLCIFFAFMWTRSRHSDKGNKNSQLQEDAPRDAQGSVSIWRMEESSTEFSMFDFSHIADATNKFSDGNKLGEGGFGRVYKGQLPNGLEIAVKRLNPHSGQGLTEFKTEIQLIAKLQHMNLVRLLGCCIQGEEKILIYEYMSNRSLDFFIFDTTRRTLLNWNKRRHIIEGISQGLLYLHKHSRLRVIHRDLKASNILLDDNMSPKISDFGLARIFGSNETHANTSRVVGTHGYMAPEYASEGLFSVKSDVFSFGVLLLEIISGKRNIGFHETGNFPNLLGYAWILWKEEKWNEVTDPCLDTSHQNMEVRRLINIALMCVQDNAVDRPNMTDIISLLMNESTSLPEPKQPAYFNIRTVNKEECVIDLEKSNSINDVTSSPPNGR